MVKLILALFAVFLVASVSAGCGSGLYGGDCSCTSDVPGLISGKSITGFTADCVDRKWTITGSGSFNIGNANWKINTDHITLSALSFNTTGATLTFTINDLNDTNSGYLEIFGPARFDGFLNFVLEDWNRDADQPTIKIDFLNCANPSGAFVPYSPAVMAKDRFCWTVLPGATITTNATYFTSLEVALKKEGGSGCGGPGDRGWVVACIVILILWGAGLGLFALITCKIDSCYSMWWELK